MPFRAYPPQAGLALGWRPAAHRLPEPGLVSARGCLCPTFNKQHANKKPPQPGRFLRRKLGRRKRKAHGEEAPAQSNHGEHADEPELIQGQLQLVHDECRIRQINKYQLQDVQGKS